MPEGTASGGSISTLLTLSLVMPLSLHLLLPALGAGLTGGLGGALLLGVMLLTPLPSQAKDQEAAQTERPRSLNEAGFGLGLALGGGLPLLLQGAGPLFGPTPGWAAEAIAGAAAGAACAAALRKRALSVTFLLPLAMLCANEILGRAPRVLATAAEFAPWPVLGEFPIAPTALTLLAFALVTCCSGAPGPWTGRGWAAGTVFWMLSTGLLGPDTAVRALALGLALMPLSRLVTGAAPSLPRGQTIAAFLAMGALALPTPNEALRATAPYLSYHDSSKTRDLARYWASNGSFETAPGGSHALSGEGNEQRLWVRGRTIRAGPETLGADHFFGHLPTLLANPALSTLLHGMTTGAVADAVRRGGPGRLIAYEPSPSLRDTIRKTGDWNRKISADPAIRFARVDPLNGPSGTLYQCILVDLPPPWAPGGATAYSAARIAAVEARLSPGGRALFRLPLPFLSGDELSTFVGRLADEFPTLRLWLDPSGAEHVLLEAGTAQGEVDAGAVLRAWARVPVREDLQAAALGSADDVLERLVTGREGLLSLVSSQKPRQPVAMAITAGRRVRSGQRAAPLATLSSIDMSMAGSLDLSGVPADKQGPLQARLERARQARGTYLKMLGHWSSGEAGLALTAAARLSSESTSPARDLRPVITPWLRRGDALKARGLSEQASAEYLMAVSFSPQDVEAQVKLADSYRLLGRTSDAEKHYNKARELEPQALAAALGLADLRLNNGEPERAIELLETAEKQHPGSYELLVNLGYIHMLLAQGSDENIANRLARSRVLFQRSIALEATRPQGLGGLAEVYFRLGEYPRALTQIDRALLLEDSCNYRSWRGHILFELGQTGAALEQVQTAILACPDLVDALVLLGNITADEGRYDRARQAWERVLELEPENHAARFNLDQLTESGVEGLKTQ